MDILRALLRIVVFSLSVPFGLVAALIPAYTAGKLAGIAGIPEAFGQYPVGAVVLFCFVMYFQNAITVKSR